MTSLNVLVLIILISICNVSVSANDDNEVNDDNFSASISGYSKFVILDDIVVNSQFDISILNFISRVCCWWCVV